MKTGHYCLKTIYVAALCLFSAAVLLSGCQAYTPESAPLSKNQLVDNSVMAEYLCPARIRVMGLTGFVAAETAGSGPPSLTIYTDLLDSFGCRKKAPGLFRFELYEFVPRVADPRGKRLFVSPDMDLTGPVENNAGWLDHLRTYRFDMKLDFVPQPGRVFILEATFITVSGRYLSDIFQLSCAQ